MIEFNKYEVHVRANGDVFIGSNHVTHFTSHNETTFCSIAEHYEPYRQLKLACMEAANAMRKVDDIIEAIARKRLNG